MMTSRPANDVLERWSALACVLIAVVLWIGPWWLRPDLFYDDAAHHVWWLYQYADPTLYPGDIAIDYFKTSAPWGYRAIYWVLVHFMDAQLAAESVAVPLLVASFVLVWRIGILSAPSEPQATGLLAIVALALMLVMSQARDVLPPIGFQRAFSLPLMLMTCWALVARRYAWVGVSWLLAALIYPVTLPVQGLAAGVVWLRDITVERRMPRHWILNGVLGAASVVIGFLGVPIPPNVGPAYSYAQAMQMPEFGAGGRLQMFDSGRFGYGPWLGGHRMGLGWPLRALALIVLATGVAAVLRRLRAVPLAAWAMAITGAALFLLMRLFPQQLVFTLYLPNRQTKWSLAVYGLFIVAVAAVALLEWFRRRWLALGAGRDLDIRRVTAAFAPLLVLAALLPHAIEVWRTPLDEDLERVYAYVAKLPPDTLVAAHPDLGNFVPLRTRRSILTSTEISMAWMQNYYAGMKPRVEASLRAAYATRMDEVDAALAPFHVHVMLTGPQAWSAPGYLQPFDALARSLQQRGEREGFVLRSPPPDRVLFRSGPYYVVRVGTCDPRHCP